MTGTMVRKTARKKVKLEGEAREARNDMIPGDPADLARYFEMFDRLIHYTVGQYTNNRESWCADGTRYWIVGCLVGTKHPFYMGRRPNGLLRFSDHSARSEVARHATRSIHPVRGLDPHRMPMFDLDPGILPMIHLPDEPYREYGQTGHFLSYFVYFLNLLRMDRAVEAGYDTNMRVLEPGFRVLRDYGGPPVDRAASGDRRMPEYGEQVRVGPGHRYGYRA